jgi:hypothetical protein
MEQELELFIHGLGVKPRVVAAVPDETVAALVARIGIESDDLQNLLVFVGENEEALKEPADTDDGADTQEPAALDRTLAALGVRHHEHVHHHHCRRIAVEVSFVGKTKYTFSEVRTRMVKRRLSGSHGTSAWPATPPGRAA